MIKSEMCLAAQELCLLKRRPAGGGGEILPNFQIFSMAQKRRQILTRNSQYLSSIDLTHYIYLKKKSVEKMLKNVF